MMMEKKEEQRKWDERWKEEDVRVEKEEEDVNHHQGASPVAPVCSVKESNKAAEAVCVRIDIWPLKKGQWW